MSGPKEFTTLAIAIQLATMRLLGRQLTASRAPLVESAGAIAGWLQPVLAAAGIISMAGCSLGLTIATPRVLYAFAQDGLLPSGFATLHPLRRSPTLAIICNTTLIAVLATVGEFGPLATGASLASMVVYVLGCLAAVRLRRRSTSEETSRDVIAWRLTPVAAVIAIVASVAIILTAPRPAQAGLFVLAATFATLAVLRKRAASAASAPA